MRRTLAAAKVSLVGTRAILVVVKVVFIVPRVLEQFSGYYRTESGHSQAGCTAQIRGCKVD